MYEERMHTYELLGELAIVKILEEKRGYNRGAAFIEM